MRYPEQRVPKCKSCVKTPQNSTGGIQETRKVCILQKKITPVGAGVIAWISRQVASSVNYKPLFCFAGTGDLVNIRGVASCHPFFRNALSEDKSSSIAFAGMISDTFFWLRHTPLFVLRLTPVHGIPANTLLD